MEVGTIRRINIDVEMQASYLDYAMSVIVARALPDVRDGLKPVHRRILYAMHDLGLASDKPYKKSARIVGEVLGKYHPHGDAAVYEAMVRMAQDFSLRYPLVDGQGNFGSIDGDNAAAMRYTEARLAPIANEMLADIDKDTVDWTDNFDGTLREPTVLPAALPNLVVNGAAGIAVGMATNIPPHNLGEVCDALCFIIDNYHRAEDISTDDLMRFIQGPDFPTGGIVFRYEHEGTGADAEQVDAIEKAYGSGRGSLVVQARAHMEEMSRSRTRIVVTELPYQTDKSRLIERIAELVRDGRIEGITDLRDESDRTGMRLCIELTRTVDTRRVLADLYKLTPLQSTFGVSLLALVDGEPRLLSLKRLLLHFLEHRQVVIVRRARHDLAQARQRAHILEGLLRALDVLDEIIALIRASRNAEAARQELKRRFEFTEVQAQAILDMQLRRLAALERQRLADEYKQTLKLIKDLEALLGSPKKVLALIRENLTDLKTRYADPRRTQIADRAKAVLTAREHAVERDVWIALDADGKLATQLRGGEEPSARASNRLPRFLATSGKVPRLLLSGNTRQDLYLFSASGRAARVQGHQWPEAPASLAELAGLKDPVVGALALSPDEAEERGTGFVLLGTVQGKVKRVNLADLRQATGQPNATPQVVGLDEGDLVVWADSSQGEGEVFFFTADGQAIRFAEEDVRAMGLPAGGIGGIKLREGDRVVAGFVLGRGPAGQSPSANGDRSVPVLAPARPLPTGVAIVTTNGFIKQVEVSDFPTQGRFGVGVMAASLSSKSGPVVGAALLGASDLLVCVGADKSSQYLPGCDIPVSARATQGRPIVLRGEQVTRVYAVILPDGGSTGPGSGTGPAKPEPGRGRRGKTAPSSTPSTPKSGRAPASSSTAAPAKSSRSRPAALQPVPEVPAPPAGLARDTSEKSVDLRKNAPKKPAHAPAAQQLPLVPEEPAATKRRQTAASARREGTGAGTAPPATSTRQSKSAGAQAAGTAGSAPGAAEKPVSSASKPTAASGAVAKPPAAPAAAKKPAASAPKSVAAQPVGGTTPPASSPTKGPASPASRATPAPRTGAQESAAPGAAKNPAPTASKAAPAPRSHAKESAAPGAAKKPASTVSKQAAGQVAGAKASPRAARQKPAQVSPNAAASSGPEVTKTPTKGSARTTAGKVDRPQTGAADAPATPLRPKHSAAEGPMTWPVLPPGDEDAGSDDAGDAFSPAPPTSRRRPRA